MEFILTNFFAISALFLMMVSIYLQMKFIKFKRGASKQLGIIKELEVKKFYKISTVEFEYEGHNYRGQALTRNHLLHKDGEVEILINPLEMTHYKNPAFIYRWLKNKNIWQQKYPKIYLLEANTLIFHFTLILFSVVLISFN